MGGLFVLVQGLDMSWVCWLSLAGLEGIYNLSWQSLNMRAHKIRASLFFRSIKANICTPKMTNEVAKAVRKATRLMPWVACPCPKVAVELVAPDELVVEAVAVVEDILRSSLGIWNYRDIEGFRPGLAASRRE